MGRIGIGHIVPLVLPGSGLHPATRACLLAIAALAAIAGLYLYEYVFVMAPQEIPNS